MEPWHWGVLLKPFILLVFAVAVILPIKLALDYFVPAGKFKRLLFKKWDGPTATRGETIFMAAIVISCWVALLIYAGFSH